MASKIRNKEYDAAYLEKVKDQLGMDFGKANLRLFKMVVWSMAKKSSMNLCFHCNQPIERSEDLSIEHKEPWRGTNSRDARPELFWNLENIAFSHGWCNSGGATRGTNKLGYLCVDEFIDRRKGGEYRKYRARHTINKKTITLGYFDDLLDAAIAADVGVMRIRNGCGPLNFEQLREEYKTYLNEKFKPNENIFYKRGPIKDIVEHFYFVLKDLEK